MRGHFWRRTLAIILFFNAALSVPGSLAFIVAAAMAFDAPGSMNDPTAWLGAGLMLATPVVVITDATLALGAWRRDDPRLLALAAALCLGWCLTLWLAAGFPPWMAFPGPLILTAYFDA